MPTQFIDVWMVNLGSEQHLWRDHWVLIWKEQFCLEESSLVWSICRAGNLNMKMSEIVLIWGRINADDYTNKVEYLLDRQRNRFKTNWMYAYLDQWQVFLFPINSNIRILSKFGCTFKSSLQKSSI